MFALSLIPYASSLFDGWCAFLQMGIITVYTEPPDKSGPAKFSTQLALDAQTIYEILVERYGDGSLWDHKQFWVRPDPARQLEAGDYIFYKKKSAPGGIQRSDSVIKIPWSRLRLYGRPAMHRCSEPRLYHTMMGCCVCSPYVSHELSLYALVACQVDTACSSNASPAADMQSNPLMSVE